MLILRELFSKPFFLVSRHCQDVSRYFQFPFLRQDLTLYFVSTTKKTEAKKTVEQRERLVCSITCFAQLLEGSTTY